MYFHQTDLKLYSKYKWEFLRRNDKYKNEWNVLLKQNADEDFVNDNADDQKTDIIFIFPKTTDTVFCPKLKSNKYNNFCFKWHIKIAVNPSNNYDEIIDDFIKELSRGFEDLGLNDITDDFIKNTAELQFKKIMFPKSLKVPVIADPFTNIEKKITSKNIKIFNFYDDEFVEEGLIKLEVNINYSKKVLIDNVSNAIDYLKRSRDSIRKNKFQDKYYNVHKFQQKDFNKDNDVERKYIEYKNSLKKKYIPPKYHFDNFPLYLKVYDLKKSGASWSTVVKRMNLNSIQTARNYYNAATRMIQKGLDLKIKY